MHSLTAKQNALTTTPLEYFYPLISTPDYLRNSLHCSIIATILVSCVQRLLRVTKSYSKVLRHSVGIEGKYERQINFLCVLILAQIMYHLTYLYQLKHNESVYEVSACAL